jgi:hypothetical protein
MTAVSQMVLRFKVASLGQPPECPSTKGPEKSMACERSWTRV